MTIFLINSSVRISISERINRFRPKRYCLMSINHFWTIWINSTQFSNPWTQRITKIANKKTSTTLLKIWKAGSKKWKKWSHCSSMFQLCWEFLIMNYLPCLKNFRLNRTYLHLLLRNSKMYLKSHLVNSHLLKSKIKTKTIWKLHQKSSSWKKAKNLQGFLNLYRRLSKPKKS